MARNTGRVMDVKYDGYEATVTVTLNKGVLEYFKYFLDGKTTAEKERRKLMVSRSEAEVRFGRGNVREWVKCGLVKELRSETGRRLFDKEELLWAAQNWQDHAAKRGRTWRAIRVLPEGI